jgi:hypothetical protein
MYLRSICAVGGQLRTGAPPGYDATASARRFGPGTVGRLMPLLLSQGPRRVRLVRMRSRMFLSFLLRSALPRSRVRCRVLRQDTVLNRLPEWSSGQETANPALRPRWCGVLLGNVKCGFEHVTKELSRFGARRNASLGKELEYRRDLRVSAVQLH